ncbi:MAG: hypothetical protein ACSLFE_11900 [Gemmatimonadaceae bacterium]
MQRHASLFAKLTASVILLACDGSKLLDPPTGSPDSPSAARAQSQTQFATLTKLPSLGSNSEALGVNDAGTVIVGHSFDRAGMLYAVKWTLQAGSWKITTLPYAGSARAMGVNDHADVAGYYASSPRRAVRWSTANVATDLDCATDEGASIANAISGGGELAVGNAPGGAAIWRAGGCRELLPNLPAGTMASGAATNADGTIIGGSAYDGALSVPVRWRQSAGQWAIEQLDSRRGRASGANGGGDLAGHVVNACALTDGCAGPVIWYVGGNSRTISTGAESSWANDINSAGEVAGVKTLSGRSTAFIWSEALGARDLAVKGSDGGARGMSDVRADGTRLVVGMAGTSAAVWLVRTQ